MSYNGLSKVISGGQTGADMAGLMAAFKKGVATGGTAPSNWYTEAGPNPLLELLGLKAEGDYRTRTIKNVRDADGTVLLTATPNSPGSMLTRNEAMRQGKPFFQVDTAGMHKLMTADSATIGDLGTLVNKAIGDIAGFVVLNRVATLNVAGNREKTKDLITTRLVERIMLGVLEHLDMSDLLIRDSDLF